MNIFREIAWQTIFDVAIGGSNNEEGMIVAPCVVVGRLSPAQPADFAWGAIKHTGLNWRWFSLSEGPVMGAVCALLPPLLKPS